MKSRTIIAILIAALLSTTVSAQEEKPGRSGWVESGNLFPGESITYRDVTIHWDASAPDLEKGTSGTLQFSSAKKEIPNFTLEVRHQNGPYDVYFDDVVLEFWQGRWRDGANSSGIVQQINFQAGHQSSIQKFDARPWKDVTVVVSQNNPIKINNWRVTISDETLTYPDGSQYYVLRADSPAADQTASIPISPSVVRKIDRFTISLGQFHGRTRCLFLSVSADPDFTIQGADTYFEDPIELNHMECLGGFLEGVSERFGIEIEWAEHPGNPESVDYLKSLKYLNANASDSIQSEILSNALDHCLRNWTGNIEYKWLDSTHLRISPKNYERVLKRKAEREKRAEGKKVVLEDWEKNYRLETRVYKLKSITPITAKTLIDQDLHDFAFLEDGVGGANIGALPIGRFREQQTHSWNERVTEQAVADDKANAVIVTAIPATHDKIAELLARMDGMLEEGQIKDTKDYKRYHIEVLLLEGQNWEESDPTYSKAKDEDGGQRKGLDTELRDVTFNEPLTEIAEMLSGISGVSINVVRGLWSETIVFNIVHMVTLRTFLEEIADLYGFHVQYRPHGVFIRHRKVEKPENYGISSEDLSKFGFDSVLLRGRATGSLIGSTDVAGKLVLALASYHTCELKYQDYRDPYLIVQGKLISAGSTKEKTLIENSLFLEPDKPTLLGLTNLREALIFVVKLRAD